MVEGGALGRQGLGALPGPGAGDKSGSQETVNIAGWERHTRGVASHMMFAMGYRRGEGWGGRARGGAEPVEVRVIPAGRSLDFIHKKGRTGEGGRGGRGERRKKKRGGEEPAEEGAGRAGGGFRRRRWRGRKGGTCSGSSTERSRPQGTWPVCCNRAWVGGGSLASTLTRMGVQTRGMLQGEGREGMPTGGVGLRGSSAGQGVSAQRAAPRLGRAFPEASPGAGGAAGRGAGAGGQAGRDGGEEQKGQGPPLGGYAAGGGGQG